MVGFWLVVIIVFVVIPALAHHYDRQDRKKAISPLTGNFVHFKTPKGVIMKVEYTDPNGFVKFREATDKDIIKLIQNKYYNGKFPK